MIDDIFWAVLTSKRDQGLAHITAIIEKSGVDEFCKFLSHNVMPVMASGGESEIHDNAAQLLICHMALVGASDALLSYRDREKETDQ